jgi:hypothetical protein
VPPRQIAARNKEQKIKRIRPTPVKFQKWAEIAEKFEHHMALKRHLCPNYAKLLPFFPLSDFGRLASRLLRTGT